MFDVPVQLVLVGVGGYATHRVFSYRLNLQYNSANGEKLLLKSYLYGFLGFSIYLILTTLFKKFFLHDLKVDTFLYEVVSNNNLKNFVKVFSFLILSGSLGFVVAEIYPEINEFNKKQLRIAKYPQPTTLIEKKLSELMLTNGEAWGFIELENNKFYVAIVLDVDINDDVPFHERFVEIQPVFSCIRYFNYFEKKEEIITTSNYIKAINGSGFGRENEVQKSLREVLSQVEKIYIPQRNIISIRTFDQNLAAAFNIQP